MPPSGPAANPSGNVARAARLVESLAAAGVAEWCVCPGGRNAPLVVVLAAAHGIRPHFGFEERSTAFFAIGRARATGRPVAVLTTSGTAAAELLPAAVEAHYSGTPLLLVTADRPPAYRGTGAPQAIEQPGLFAGYAPTVHDDGGTGGPVALPRGWRADGPLHVNICFDEPLMDRAIPDLVVEPADPPRPALPFDDAPLEALLASAARLLVLAGPLDRSDHDAVRAFLLRLGAPVYAEPASGLREDAALRDLAFTSGEAALATVDPDAVLRVGGVPTVRFWRDLETRLAHVPVCSVSALPFPGLTRGAVVRGSPAAVLAEAPGAAGGGPATRAWLERDRRRAVTLAALLEGEPRSEPGLLRALSRTVPRGALVYLGNSLPIREWDLAAVREARGWEIAASRGANGIDGQLSTFFGHCGPEREHWAVVGDLTALYDLSAPWLLERMSTGPVRLVIVNNHGGRIFARLSPHAVLRNPHAVEFADWARMWGLAYYRWAEVPGTAPRDERCVVELVPDAESTERFWRAYDALEEAG